MVGTAVPGGSRRRPPTGCSISARCATPEPISPTGAGADRHSLGPDRRPLHEHPCRPRAPGRGPARRRRRHHRHLGPAVLRRPRGQPAPAADARGAGRPGPPLAGPALRPDRPATLALALLGGAFPALTIGPWRLALLAVAHTLVGGATGLAVGPDATAVVRASDVMIGVDRRHPGRAGVRTARSDHGPGSPGAGGGVGCFTGAVSDRSETIAARSTARGLPLDEGVLQAGSSARVHPPPVGGPGRLPQGRARPRGRGADRGRAVGSAELGVRPRRVRYGGVDRSGRRPTHRKRKAAQGPCADDVPGGGSAAARRRRIRRPRESSGR